MPSKAVSVAPELDPLALLGGGAPQAQNSVPHTATHSLASSNRTSEAGSEPPSPLSPVGKLIEPLLPAEQASAVAIGAPAPVAALVIDAKCTNATSTSIGGSAASASVCFRIVVQYCVVPNTAVGEGQCPDGVQEWGQNQHENCKKTSTITRTLRQVWSLRDELRAECPGTVLPPAPVSSGLGVGQSGMALHLQQQLWECNCFIAALATHPVLAASQATRAFFALKSTLGKQTQAQTGGDGVKGRTVQLAKDRGGGAERNVDKEPGQEPEPEQARRERETKEPASPPLSLFQTHGGAAAAAIQDLERVARELRRLDGDVTGIVERSQWRDPRPGSADATAISLHRYFSELERALVSLRQRVLQAEESVNSLAPRWGEMRQALAAISQLATDKDTTCTHVKHDSGAGRGVRAAPTALEPLCEAAAALCVPVQVVMARAAAPLQQPALSLLQEPAVQAQGGGAACKYAACWLGASEGDTAKGGATMNAGSAIPDADADAPANDSVAASVQPMQPLSVLSAELGLLGRYCAEVRLSATAREDLRTAALAVKVVLDAAVAREGAMRKRAQSEAEVQQLRLRVREAETVYKRAHTAASREMGRFGTGTAGTSAAAAGDSSVTGGTDHGVRTAMRNKRAALLGVQEQNTAYRSAVTRARLKWGVAPLTEQVVAARALLRSTETQLARVHQRYISDATLLQHSIPRRLRALLKHVLEAESRACERLDVALARCNSQLMQQAEPPVNDADSVWLRAANRSETENGSTRTGQGAEAQQLQFFDPFEAAVAAAIAPREHTPDWLQVQEGQVDSPAGILYAHASHA